MAEPKAITYREVAKAFDSGAGAAEAWRKIGEITGAGHVPAGDDATIDLTEVSEAKQSRIEKLLAKEADEPETPETSSTEKVKRGGK
jgi:hypothetical protein